MILFALILFILSFLVITGLFLVKYTEVFHGSPIRVRLIGQAESYERVWPYFQKKLKIAGRKLWHFILEAKDLKPAATKTVNTQVERMKKVFRVRIRTQENEPQWLPEATNLTVKPELNQNPEDIYLEMIKKNPQDYQAYESLGRLYLQNKNYNDAAEIYKYLTQLHPIQDIYWSNLGLSYFSLKEFSQAASAYEKALGINNKVPTRWVNLALCFEALTDFNKAVKAMLNAINLDSGNLSYLGLLADAYINLGNSVRAEEVLQNILVQDPTNKVAREKLMKFKI